MPLKRKLVKIGHGTAIFIPHTWLKLIEEEHGPIEHVTIEVNGTLTIKPIIKEKEQ